jgi:hypothetical protein
VATEPPGAPDGIPAALPVSRRIGFGAALLASCAAHAAAVTLLGLPVAGGPGGFEPMVWPPPQPLQIRLAAVVAQVDAPAESRPAANPARLDRPAATDPVAAESSVSDRAATEGGSATIEVPPAGDPGMRYQPADGLDMAPVPASEPDLAPVAAAFRQLAPVRVRIYVSTFGPPDRIEILSPATDALSLALQDALAATNFLPGRLAGHDVAAYIELEIRAELLVAGPAAPVTPLPR